jgi:hypothetical protein
MEPNSWRQFTEAVKPTLVLVFHPIDSEARVKLKKMLYENMRSVIQEIQANEAKHAALFCVCARTYKVFRETAEDSPPPALNFIESEMNKQDAGIDKCQSEEAAVNLFKGWMEQVGCCLDETSLKAFLTQPVQEGLLKNIQRIREFYSSQEKLDAFFYECAEFYMEFNKTPPITGKNISLKLIPNNKLLSIDRNTTIHQAMAKVFVESGRCSQMYCAQEHQQDLQKTFSDGPCSREWTVNVLTHERWKYVAKSTLKERSRSSVERPLKD